MDWTSKIWSEDNSVRIYDLQKNRSSEQRCWASKEQKYIKTYDKVETTARNDWLVITLSRLPVLVLATDKNLQFWISTNTLVRWRFCWNLLRLEHEQLHHREERQAVQEIRISAVQDDQKDETNKKSKPIKHLRLMESEAATTFVPDTKELWHLPHSIYDRGKHCLDLPDRK